MKHSKIHSSRGETDSKPSHRVPPLRPSPNRRLWYLGAIICIAVAGFFLASPACKRGPSQKKALPRRRRSAPLWSDPDPNAPPEKIAQHFKAEGLEVGRQMMRELPGKADSILLMGQVHYRHGNTSEAMAFWKKGLKLDPKRADAYDGMGWIAMRKGDYETAVSHWRKALKIQPNMPGVHNSLARALMGLGRFEEAVSALQKDVLISPKSSLSYFLLGQAYLQLKKLDQAKEAYERAIEIDPACTNAYYGLAAVLVRLHQTQKARQYMEKFRKLKAEDMKVLKSRNKAYDDLKIMRGLLAQTHEDAGRICRKYGRLREAEQHWRRAAALNPKNTSCRTQLALLYERTRRIPEAIHMYKQVRKLRPDNLDSCLALASLYVRAGRFTDAQKTFREAIELAPESSAAYRGLALLYLGAKTNFSDAKTLAQKAVALEPTAPNYDILGWAFYANGQVGESLSAMQHAIELDPTNAGYKRRYEQILRRRQ